MLKVTNAALRKIIEIRNNQLPTARGVRIIVVSKVYNGPGFNYKIGWFKEDDQVFASHSICEFTHQDEKAVKVEILIDRESLQYILGSTLDYVETTDGPSGFMICNQRYDHLTPG